MKARISSLFAWKRPVIATAVNALLAAVLCFVPLFDVLGYELSLAVALSSSFFAGWVASAYPQRVRDQLAPYPGARWTVARLYGVVAALGVATLILPLALASANALRVRNCDYLEGLGFYFLGPVAAVLVATAWGLAAGLVAPGRRWATAVWVVFWLGAIGLQLHTIWATPAVRVLGSFHGYFSGVLYDEEVVLPTALLSLRLRDVVVVLAILLSSAWLLNRTTLRLSLGAAKGRRSTGGAALLAAGLALLAIWAAPLLGHRRDAADVARALGGSTTFERCTIIHADSLPEEQARLVARDCAFRLDQVETFFDARLTEPLTVFLFESSDQKQELIGAGRTSVAKPWRGEVYIQGAQFPHPVLRHEIAHVVAGEFGARPLKVGGRLGGILPSPGLIEGAAVAAEWSRGELSPHGWSKAMHDLGVAPELPSVMGLGFLGVNPGRAYVIAGSFVRFLIEEEGPERFRRAYGSADLEGTYGASLAELGRRWTKRLGEEQLDAAALQLARDRFDRPSVFAKVCAHEVAQLRRRCSVSEARGAWAEAISLRRRIASHTDDEPWAMLELARTLVAADRRRRARAILGELCSEATADRRARLAACHLEADIDWVEGRRSEALSAYARLLDEPDRVGARRLLAVKADALRSDGAEPFVRRFLLGGERLGAERSDLALLTLAELVAARPGYGVGHYLLGRQLWSRDEHERARPYLERALELGLPDWSLHVEARRIHAITTMRAGDLSAARRLFAALAADEGLPRGLRDEAADWVERCEWEREHPAP